MTPALDRTAPPAREPGGPTYPSRPYPASALGAATAAIGALLVAFGFLSSYYAVPDLFRDPLSGYDPPFDAIAGVLLLALAFRIRDRSPVAWIFTLIAPALTIPIAFLSPNAFSVGSAIASTGLVALLFPYRLGFYRGSATGPEATQLLVIVAALLTLLFGMVGSKWLAGQFSTPSGSSGIHNWTDALYFTVATISTNGSNYTPTTDVARWFSIVLILLGVGTFLSAVVVLFLPFLEARLERIARRLERAQMEDLTAHVIVCGTSSAARAVADAFREQHVPAVILAADAGAIGLFKNEGYRTFLGEPSSETVLRACGLDRARAVVAADDSDAENLLTVITVRGMAPRARIVAIAASPGAIGKLLKAGANEAISMVAVAARLVTAAALRAPDEPGARSGPTPP
ncbi:MAG TPA: NAD-binding protein [Thermoplasmata archaeon]|nr:NAD-binding protein [Thermoplasmata archaeon]